MIRLSWLFLFLVPFLADWEEFRSETGRFRVVAPQKMQHKIDSTNTAVGDLIYHTYYTQGRMNQIYMITYCDYPEGSIHADSTDLVEDFFDVTIASAAESVAGEILYIQKEKLQKVYRGKRWRIDYMDGAAIIRTRAFLIGNRYYSVQVVSSRENSVNSETQRFMNSFRILEATSP